MVLRVGHGADFAKDAAVAAVAGGTLPVPAVTARGQASGWVYAVSERATGTPLDDRDVDGVAAALPALFDVMDGIARIDVGGRGYGQWEPDRVGPYRSWPQALLAIEWKKAPSPAMGGLSWPPRRSAWSPSNGRCTPCAGSRWTCRMSVA